MWSEKALLVCNKGRNLGSTVTDARDANPKEMH